MPLRRYVDGTEYRAWLIGCDAPGVEKDVAELTACLEGRLGPGYRVSVERPMAPGAGTVTRDQVEATFRSMDQFRGHRIVWFGGHGDVREDGRFFRTQGRPSNHVPLEWLYDQLDALARSGSAPLWAVMDFCHAAPQPREWSEKLILFCAAHGDEAARGTEAEGGLFTQAIIKGLTAAQANDAGQITVDALLTWVNAEVAGGHQHPFFSRGHYGTRVLNRVQPAAPAAMDSSQPTAAQERALQDTIVHALLDAGLADPQHRDFLFRGLPNTYLHGVAWAGSPLNQLHNDVKFLAEAEPDTAQDEPPLAMYLANACELARSRPEKRRKALIALREQVLLSARRPATAPPLETRQAPPRSMSKKALRDALCQAYGDSESARRVCADAGLAVERIRFDGAIKNVWFSAVNEADLSNRLEALQAVAHDDYPDMF